MKSCVFDHLERAGFRALKSKCEFMFPSVSYLGYQLNKVGLHPLQEMVMVVKEAPNQRNTSELKSYLGLLTYYSKFLPSMVNTLAPLYRLLRKDVH